MCFTTSFIVRSSQVHHATLQDPAACLESISCNRQALSHCGKSCDCSSRHLPTHVISASRSPFFVFLPPSMAQNHRFPKLRFILSSLHLIYLDDLSHLDTSYPVGFVKSNRGFENGTRRGAKAHTHFCVDDALEILLWPTVCAIPRTRSKGRLYCHSATCESYCNHSEPLIFQMLCYLSFT